MSCPNREGQMRNKAKAAFTLIEVILVAVVITILTAITIPNYASSLKGSKLRTSSRTIQKMARYARSMAITREKTITIAINPQTLEIYLGQSIEDKSNQTDGVLDQGSLKRLGYIDDESTTETNSGNITKEVHKFLPKGITIDHFQKRDSSDLSTDVHLIHFYKNGQCDSVKLKLADNRNMGVELEIDPISGKITSEFTQ